MFAAAAPAQVELKIEGMKCAGCTSRVEKALQKLEFVQSVKVSLDEGKAWIDMKGSQEGGGTAELVKAVVDLGFEAKV